MIDQRIVVGLRRIPVDELKGAGWHGFWALFLNRVRMFAERWATHHAIQVLISREPALIDELAHYATINKEFKEYRGKTTASVVAIPLEEQAKNEQELALARLGQLGANGRAKRYVRGRRTFTMYEVTNEEGSE